MRASSIQTGLTYQITLGRNEVPGEVIAETATGWTVRLIASGKMITVNNPKRFLCKSRMIPIIREEQEETEPVTESTSETTTEQSKHEGLSGLDAAHKVLLEIGTPLNVRQIADAIRERGYAPNLNGKTPQATISSGIQRELRDKPERSRFYKVSKGLFAAVECRQE